MTTIEAHKCPKLKCSILIAELSRRIGDIEYATRYFSKVIEKQSTSLEPKIIEMAKERWQEIRDEKQKEA